MLNLSSADFFPNLTFSKHSFIQESYQNVKQFGKKCHQQEELIPLFIMIDLFNC